MQAQNEICSAVSGAGDVNAGKIAQAFRDSACRVAVICGADPDYETLAAPVAAALKAAGAERVILAGRLGGNDTAWRAAGIDTEIYLGCNALDILQDLQKDLEVPA